MISFFRYDDVVTFEGVSFRQINSHRSTEDAEFYRSLKLFRVFRVSVAIPKTAKPFIIKKSHYLY